MRGVARTSSCTDCCDRGLGRRRLQRRLHRRPVDRYSDGDTWIEGAGCPEAVFQELTAHSFEVFELGEPTPRADVEAAWDDWALALHKLRKAEPPVDPALFDAATEIQSELRTRVLAGWGEDGSAVIAEAEDLTRLYPAARVVAVAH